MSHIEVLQELAKTNPFAAELLAARQRTEIKIEVKETGATDPILITDLDRLLDPKTDFDTFIKLANKLDGFTKE
ncbi:MAG: hypothetical protein WCY05_05215 [Candidatus Omnitrophota bacterium]